MFMVAVEVKGAFHYRRRSKPSPNAAPPLVERDDRAVTLYSRPSRPSHSHGTRCQPLPLGRGDKTALSFGFSLSGAVCHGLPDASHNPPF